MKSRQLHVLATGALLTTLSASGGNLEGQHCPVSKSINQMTLQERAAYEQSQARSYKKATVLVGVDNLGRVLIAIDKDKDGLADECALYTDMVRLSGPWSRLIEDADIESRLGTFKIEARDKSFALAIATRGSELPTLKGKGRAFAQVFAEDDGAELARMMPGAYQTGMALANMSHDDVFSWPEAFWYDGLSLASCQNCLSADCDTGGCGANSCSIGPSQGCTITQCSTNCGIYTDQYFACCKCTISGNPCRCIGCIPHDP